MDSANHIHSVWSDFAGDFGGDALRRITNRAIGAKTPKGRPGFLRTGCGYRIIGLERERALQGGDRFNRAPGLGERTAEILLYLGEAGIEQQRPFIVPDSFFHAPLFLKGDREVIVHLRPVRLEPQCLLIMWDGRLQTAFLAQCIAEIIVGLGEFRLQPQGPAPVLIEKPERRPAAKMNVAHSALLSLEDAAGPKPHRPRSP